LLPNPSSSKGTVINLTTPGMARADLEGRTPEGPSCGPPAGPGPNAGRYLRWRRRNPIVSGHAFAAAVMFAPSSPACAHE